MVYRASILSLPTLSLTLVRFTYAVRLESGWRGCADSGVMGNGHWAMVSKRRRRQRRGGLCAGGGAAPGEACFLSHLSAEMLGRSRACCLFQMCLRCPPAMQSAQRKAGRTSPCSDAPALGHP